MRKKSWFDNSKSVEFVCLVADGSVKLSVRDSEFHLDVAQEKRIDDYRNVDENRSLSDSWTGFTRFTLLTGKPPKGYMWSGWRLTKFQTTSRPDHVWPEVWTRIGKAARNKEKQKWAIEKPKTWECQKFERNLFDWSEWWRVQKHHQECKTEIGNTDDSCNVM